MTGKRPSHLKIAPEVMVDFDNIQKAYAHVNIPELHELLETIMNGYPYPPSLLKDTSQEWSLYFQGVSVYEAGTNFLGTFVRMQKIQFSFQIIPTNVLDEHIREPNKSSLYILNKINIPMPNHKAVERNSSRVQVEGVYYK